MARALRLAGSPGKAAARIRDMENGKREISGLFKSPLKRF